MRVLVRIDQSEAIRQGIDAPNSTEHIEFDPADLAPDERDLLARMASGGHDLTHSVVRIDDPQLPVVRVRSSEKLLNPDSDSQGVVVLQSNPEALRAQLREIINGPIRVAKARRQEANEAFEAAIEGETTETLTVVVNAYGDGGVDQSQLEGGGLSSSRFFGDPWAKRLPEFTASERVTLPTFPIRRYVDYKDGCHGRYRKYADSGVVERFDREARRIQAERREIIDAAIEKLKAGPYEEHRQRVERERAEFQALYARLPEVMRSRYEDGYGSWHEIESAIKSMIVSDAGFDPDRTPASTSTDVGRLSDQQYQALRELRPTYPDTQAVLAYQYPTGHRPARDDDDPAVIDEDGEVPETGQLLLAVPIERAGRTLYGYVPVLSEAARVAEAKVAGE